LGRTHGFFAGGRSFRRMGRKGKAKAVRKRRGSPPFPLPSSCLHPHSRWAGDEDKEQPRPPPNEGPVPLFSASPEWMPTEAGGQGSAMSPKMTSFYNLCNSSPPPLSPVLMTPSDPPIAHPPPRWQHNEPLGRISQRRATRRLARRRGSALSALASQKTISQEPRKTPLPRRSPTLPLAPLWISLVGVTTGPSVDPWARRSSGSPPRGALHRPHLPKAERPAAAGCVFGGGGL